MTQEEFNILLKPIYNLAFCIGYLSQDATMQEKLLKFDEENDKARILLCEMHHRSQE